MPLNINVSDKAAQERKPFEDLPEGWYRVRISDVELRESQSEKNSGKPMYNFEFTVTEDTEVNPTNADGASEFADRRVWVNACLWEGAEFTIVNIMRALGYEIQPGALAVPDITNDEEIDAFLGRELDIKYGVTKKERARARREGDEASKEVTSFRSADPDAAPKAAPSVGTKAPGGRRRVLA